jgi:voltage-gated potassium channel
MDPRNRQSFGNLLRDIYTEDRFQIIERIPRAKRYMDWAILILAVASVLMFAMFFLFHLRVRALFRVSIALDVIFFVDYILRTYYSGKRFGHPWSAALAKNNYCARWYGIIDAIAVFPSILAHLIRFTDLLGSFSRISRIMRIFRVARVLRIVRSFRILRESARLSKNIRRFQSKLRAEFRFAFILIAVILLLGMIGLYELESPTNPEFHGVGPLLYWSLMSLFGQYDTSVIHSPYSQFIGLVIVFCGVAFLGVISGSITSFFMDKINRHMKGKDPFRGDGHVVICGWNSKVPELLQHLSRIENVEYIVLLFDRGRDEEDLGGLTEFKNRNASVKLKTHWVRGDPRNPDHLHSANLTHARKVIVLADETADLKDEQDKDARTLLTTQIINTVFDEETSPAKRRPDITVELLSQQSVSIATRMGVNHIVYADEIICQYMVLDVHSRSAGKVFERLIEPEDENVYIIRVIINDDAIGKDNFLSALETHCRESKSILLGVEIQGALFVEALRGNHRIYDMLSENGLLSAAEEYFTKSTKRHLRAWVDSAEGVISATSIPYESFPILNIRERLELVSEFVGGCEFVPGQSLPLSAVLLAGKDPLEIIL